MMTLAEIMTRHLVTVEMDETLGEVRTLFDRYRFHHLLVVRDGILIGLVSDRDLLKNISPFLGSRMMERTQDTNTLQRRVHQVMTRNPIVGSPDMLIPEAAKLLVDRNVSCLPVVNESMRPRGIVTWRDLLMHCHFCGSPERGQDDDSGESRPQAA